MVSVIGLVSSAEASPSNQSISLRSSTTQTQLRASNFDFYHRSIDNRISTQKSSICLSTSLSTQPITSVIFYRSENDDGENNDEDDWFTVSTLLIEIAVVTLLI